MIPNLEKKYEKNLPLEEITEKDIIFFARDNLNFYVSKEYKIIYEKEILYLIKMKEWDWVHEDIDKNNILVYPIHNNAFSIVKYLIENNKYNLQEYHKSISKAVCSCIMPIGEEMNQYLLSKDIHTEYIADMVFQAYSMALSDKMRPDYVDYYKQKAENLFQKNASFEKILHHFLNTDEFHKYKMTLVNFLEQHPLSREEKLAIVKPILEEGKEKSLAFIKREKNRVLDNWVRYVELDIQLKPKNLIHKKTKI